jgi:hypothetical protein
MLHGMMLRPSGHAAAADQGEVHMKVMMIAAAKMLAVTLCLVAFGSAGPALADDDDGTPEEQRDCRHDAMTYCSQYIFAPDRNKKIGDCLWQRRAQISRECRSHLRPPRK